MLYSKNGSIPYPYTDGTEGWIEVEDPPVAPEGKEVVWWYPPGWVVRDPMPVKEGFKYSWSQSEERWVEHALPVVEEVPQEPAASEPEVVLSSEQIPALTSADISALE
jgi:hypothetical protein